MKVLMCPPEFFDVTYEINAWMQIVTKPDTGLAKKQWSDLYTILRDDLGCDISLVKPAATQPDMVFTANAGLVYGRKVVPSRFRFAERQGEVEHFNRWFMDQGYQLTEIDDTVSGSFEGEGDALFYGDTLLAGYRQRSDASVYANLANLINKEVLPLELVDTRWYHIDTCLIPLRRDLLAYYPPAFDEYAQRVLHDLPGKKIILTEHDALRFGGNAVVCGDRVAMNSGCEELKIGLESNGFKVFPTDLSEFLKSGGAAKCLTLVLEHEGLEFD